MKKEIIDKDKYLLKLEWIILSITIISFFTIILLIPYLNISKSLLFLIIFIACLILIMGASASLKIEQIAGYYQCRKCKHKYIPKYLDVFFAMHIGRTRYMKCQKCQKYSWNKKVLTKDEDV